MAGDLEEAVVEAAVAHVLDQLGLCFGVVSVEDCLYQYLLSYINSIIPR